MIEQAKLPTLFSVSKTEYQTLVMEFLSKVRLPSKLHLEIRSVLNMINYILLPTVLVRGIYVVLESNIDLIRDSI